MVTSGLAGGRGDRGQALQEPAPGARRRAPGVGPPDGQLLEDLTRGNVTQVKVVLASVAAALAVYQVLLMVVGYGKVRLRALSAPAASWTHRAAGDAIVVLIACVALACIGYYGFDDDETLHIVAGTALLAVLGLKVAIIRWWHGMGRLLPLLGITVFLLLAVTWMTSAGSYLADD